MNAIPANINETEAALGRAGLYQALSLGFRPPTSETLSRLCLAQQNEALQEIAEFLQPADSALQAAVDRLRHGHDAGSPDDLEQSYRSLFGHVAHATVPPYETEYGSETLFQQPQQLGDLSGFYSAFGLKPERNEHERVDHISFECEFLSFLNLKQAYARQEHKDEMLAETQKAERLFLRDHLARFAFSFANLLQREAPQSLYSALGQVLREFVLLECTRLNVAAGPENLRLRPRMTVDDCFTCGAGQGLIQEISGQQIASAPPQE